MTIMPTVFRPPSTCSVQGVGFRVLGAEFRVEGLGLRVEGLGFRV